MEEQEYEISLVFSNTRDEMITFYLEPWGEYYEMEPRVLFTLVLRSPIKPSPPNETVIVNSDVDCLTVFAWRGCVATLFRNGEMLGPSQRTRF